jgi:replication factor C subunit 2/4
MTSDAQSALRRIMEAYSKMTRFCLICNYVSRIIEPLASRCAKFRFKPLHSTSIQDKLLNISQLEGLQLSMESCQALVQYSEGDLRKAIMFLQSLSRFVDKDQLIEPTMIADIAGAVPIDLVQTLLNLWSLTDTSQALKMVESLVQQGYSATQLLNQVCFLNTFL